MARLSITYPPLPPVDGSLGPWAVVCLPWGEDDMDWDHCNFYYFKPNSTPLTLPVHALVFWLDWSNLHIADWQTVLPNPLVLHDPNILLFDGSVLHTYGQNQTIGATMGSTAVQAYGVPLIQRNSRYTNIRGFDKIVQSHQWGFWPASNHIDNHGSLNGLGWVRWLQFARSLLDTAVTSEGNVWLPVLWQRKPVGNLLEFETIRVDTRLHIRRKSRRRQYPTPTRTQLPPFPTSAG